MTDLPERLLDPEEEWSETLHDAAREELIWLWADLADARRHAIRGCWSIECASLTVRIVALSRHVGALCWEEVDFDLLRSGVYMRIHQEAGLVPPPIDWEAVDRHEQYLADRAHKARE